jgi:DNA (cytosine-5)-methyltransferase 1
VTLEQVPDVLPYWKMVGGLLAEAGYSWWAGVLEAERYGVPQTRERAILIARRDGLPALPPEPTHRRYVKGKDNDPHDTLFGDGLLPWVSMAEALGWGDVTVNTRGVRQTPGGNEFTADAPSWALTEKARSWQYRANTMPNAAVRELGEPAPTMAFGHDAASAAWVHSRPATTIVGSYRPDIVAGPGFRHAGDGPRQDAPGSIRVTVHEAALLQTFPADYPWQGSRTKQFQQVGNAIPPMLARAILRTVIAA